MDFVEFTAGKDDENRRLDRVVRKLIPDCALSGIYRALRNGLIKVNGSKKKEDYKVLQSDKITVASFLLNGSENNNAQNKAQPLSSSLIILKTADLLFINKPYDIPVQKADKNETALNELVCADYDFYHPRKESLSFTAGPLHRLDKKTTGLIAFSQSIEGARVFSRALSEHKTVKTYLAVLQGTLKKEELWSDRIEKTSDESKNSFHTVNISDSGKESLTRAIPLAHGKYNGQNVTLAEITIWTGRTHQIRSVSAYHGFPLAGDTAYGAKKISASQSHFLHSYKISFKESVLDLPQEIICPIRKEFKEFLKSALIIPPSEL